MSRWTVDPQALWMQIAIWFIRNSNAGDPDALEFTFHGFSVVIDTKGEIPAKGELISTVVKIDVDGEEVSIDQGPSGVHWINEPSQMAAAKLKLYC